MAIEIGTSFCKFSKILIEQGPGGRVEANPSDLCEREQTRRRCQASGDLQRVTPIIVGYLGNSVWVVGETKKRTVVCRQSAFIFFGGMKNLCT